jgi:hypothetical protein
MNVLQRIPVIHFPVYEKDFKTSQNSEGHIHGPQILLPKLDLLSHIFHILPSSAHDPGSCTQYLNSQ